MKINELFDPKGSFEIEWDDQFGPKEIHAVAYDRQGRTINIDFVPIADNIVEIEFTRGGSYDVTNRGDATQVLTTVVNAIKIYLTKFYSAPYLIFSAKEASRSGLYQAMIRRLATSGGYKQIPYDQASDEFKNDLPLGQHDVFILAKQGGV